jgi:ferrochelatase
MTTDAVLLLAHGTIAQMSELREFLTRIRRGRAPSDELLAEMQQRYDAIGGSPLLQRTHAQAAALSHTLDMPCAVAMRLWPPGVEEVLPELQRRGAERVCLLPLAPFSTQVYNDAALAAAQQLPGFAQLRFAACGAWGEHPRFVRAQAELIRRHLPDRPCDLILTAHSLPMSIIAGGDPYASQSAAAARAIERELGRPATLAYQSEGAGGGEWLGPSLEHCLDRAAARGSRTVAVAPFGFLAEHVETLYDLDIEARALAESKGLEFVRVPALDDDPEFIAALAEIASTALASER